MTGILSEVVLVSTAGLLALPLVTRRFRRSFRRSEHAKFNAAAVGGGLLLFQVALVVCAIPAVASAVGVHVEDRHFFPGEDVIGWVSAVIAVVLGCSLLVGYGRFRRSDSLLFVEPGLGRHEDRGWYELVILESPRPLAYAHDGTRRQVVLTSGLVAALTPAELDAVVDHELAHLRNGHHRFLALAAALDPAASVVPGLKRVIANLRLSVELWADGAVRDRTAARTALVKLSCPGPPAPAAAFTAADIEERVLALRELHEPRTGGLPRPMLYFAAGACTAISVAALWVYWF